VNETGNRRAFLDLLGRVIRNADAGPEPPDAAPEPTRLILP
jgi:hypothetical protein